MILSHFHVLNMTFEVMYINHLEKPKTKYMHKKNQEHHQLTRLDACLFTSVSPIIFFFWYMYPQFFYVL